MIEILSMLWPFTEVRPIGDDVARFEVVGGGGGLRLLMMEAV
jgi:hypothetical protein